VLYRTDKPVAGKDTFNLTPLRSFLIPLFPAKVSSAGECSLSPSRVFDHDNRFWFLKKLQISL